MNRPSLYRLARLQAGYTTQAALSATMALSVTTISNVESGRTEPSLDTMRKYKKYLGLTFDEMESANSARREQ